MLESLNPTTEINNTPNITVDKKAVMYRPNFKASEDKFVRSTDLQKQQETERKNAKRKSDFLTAVSVAGSLALLTVAGITGKQFYDQWKAGKEATKTIFKDLTKEKKLSEMALPDSLKDATDRVVQRIKNGDLIAKKGGKKGSAILLYGPPGTGKNTFTYAISKEFPNAKLVDLDVSRMNSMWHGESEKNIMKSIDGIVKYADKNKNEKIFVFIDEIDSVMMVDNGAGSGKTSNDVLNAFKKGFNKLTKQDNIIVVGATNLEIDAEKTLLSGSSKQLDTAMLSRFAEKVLVDLPTGNQIKNAFVKTYSKPEFSMVAEELKDANNATLSKICDFLSEKHHQTSFRTIGSIIDTAATKSKADEKVCINDVIEAIKSKKEELHISDQEMEKFLNSLK